MRDVVIVSAARSPIGSFGGSLKDVSAVELGIQVAKGAIERAGITPDQIDDVYIGNILSAGLGQGVARQISVGAGIPFEVPAMTINLLCGSGLRAVSLAAQLIGLGDADIILAGGTESMTRAPHLSNNVRSGTKMGSLELKDSMLVDALTDAFHNYHMGITAENIVTRWELDRPAQDEFALRSQHRAEQAQAEGKFVDEIVPITISQRRGEPLIVAEDEYIRKGATIEGLEKLRPAFDKEGSVTAGNASGINDGAAMLIVMSKDKANELGLEYLAIIKGYGTAGVDPSIMGIGPVPAVKQAMDRTGWNIDDLDLIEANEAFAAQSLAVVNDLGLNPEKVNVNGGAIALGHPVGASGARILTTLLYEMKRRDAKRGLATLCIGGGMGTALLVERP